MKIQRSRSKIKHTTLCFNNSGIFSYLSSVGCPGQAGELHGGLSTGQPTGLKGSAQMPQPTFRGLVSGLKWIYTLLIVYCSNIKKNGTIAKLLEGLIVSNSY